MRYSPLTRRDFVRGAATVGVGVWVCAPGETAPAASPNEKPDVGMIGVGGMGAGNMQGIIEAGGTVTVLCDADANTLKAAVAKRYAEAFQATKTYADYRKMLEAEKKLSAVVVSIPDHHHAFATMMALKLGRHVYCEKPLTHSVWEAREIVKAAARAKVATQMGNRAHSSEGLRRTVEFVQAGAIGHVKEVHCWSDRPIWPQGIDRPADTPDPPPHLDWDLWLGPAPERPFNPIYHPFRWRGWWDFGTGALGDMACHIMDVAVWALKLGSPTSVEAEGEPRKPETAPLWSLIRYQFPPRSGGLPAVKMTWYDGKKGEALHQPPPEVTDGIKLETNGTIFVGEKGRIYCGLGGAPQRFAADAPKDPKEKDFKEPPPSLPRLLNGNHYIDFLAAVKGGPKAGSSFEVAGALTEIVLLGNVALRAGKRIEWEGATLKAKNCPEADPFIRRDYRKGWAL
jgi:predicted dehydrogenase